MKRSISPVPSLVASTMSRKRTKRDISVESSSSCEDDAAAMLLALSSETCRDKKGENLVENDYEDSPRRVIVSDDECDDEHSVCSSSQVSVASATTMRASPPRAAAGDWRAISRPLLAPPRLPMVPAGYIFPPRKQQDALRK